jgi:hypothetical protein
MSTVLVARFKSKREAAHIEKLIKEYRKNSTVVISKSFEDIYLGEMINEGLREKGIVPLAEFKTYLDKRIKALDK